MWAPVRFVSVGNIYRWVVCVEAHPQLPGAFGILREALRSPCVRVAVNRTYAWVCLWSVESKERKLRLPTRGDGKCSA